MPQDPTLLAVLLDQRGLSRYGAFSAAYVKAARSLDPALAAQSPSRAQFYRWTTGGLRGLPFTANCRVLEHMLPGYTAAQLLAPCTGQQVPAPGRVTSRQAVVPGLTGGAPPLAGVEAVFASRSEFAARVQLPDLIDGSPAVRAAGLSLNMICQQLPDQYLAGILTGGTQLSCLFLDPAGKAIGEREREELHTPGVLSGLTRLNIDTLARLRDKLPADARDRLTIAVYDETIRYNILIADGRAAVVQPYLPQARGVESPTLIVSPGTGPGSLYPVFENIWDALASRSTPL
ncbi:MAG: DUF5919 domain-containing protein [Streptosporangiaceae bacterium]